jgi:hypothetical protein
MCFFSLQNSPENSYWSWFKEHQGLFLNPRPEIIHKENQCGLLNEGRSYLKTAKKVVKADKSIYAMINKH